MKNKVVGIMMAVCMTAALLSGCGSGSASSSGSAQSSSGEEKTEAAAESTQPAADAIQMRICYTNADNTQQGMNMIFFEEKVEELTGGRVDVVRFPNASLGTTADEVNMVLNGACEATYTFAGTAESTIPLEGYVMSPFLFTVYPGDTSLERAVFEDQQVHDIMEAAAEAQGLKRFGIIPTGLGSFLIANNTKEIAKPEDAAGMKIRSAGSEGSNIMLEACGASPTSIAASELAVALQQGVVDGLTTSLTYYHEANLHTKYVTMPYANGSTTPFYVSLKWWNDLPEDLQDIIENQAVPAMFDYACECLEKTETEYYEAIQNEPYNVKVTVMDVSSIKDQCIETGIQKLEEKAGPDARTVIERVIEIKGELGIE